MIKEFHQQPGDEPARQSANKAESAMQLSQDIWKDQFGVSANKLRRTNEVMDTSRYLVFAGDEAPRPASPAKVLTELDKKILGLIQELGDDKFATRNRAQADLERLGSAAFGHLEKAKKDDPDLEIRARARQAQDNIITSPPREPEQLQKAHANALDEIQKTGKISKATDAAFRQQINQLDGHTMTESEAERRSDRLRKLAYDEKTPIKDQIAAFKELSKVYAMRSIGPGDQARLDYADVLIRSGQKREAVDVLSNAIKANPKLANTASFRVYAEDSGATKNAAFATAVETATGKKGRVKEWNDNARGQLYDRISHMSHESHRVGPTERQIKHDWPSLLKDLDAAALKPGLEAFANVHKGTARRELVDALTESGRSKEATKVMTEMLKLSPDWVNAAWMRVQSRLNGSRDDAAFKAAVAEARKKVPEQFSGQGDP